VVTQRRGIVGRRRIGQARGRGEMQKVGTGVRQARVQAVNVLLDLALFGSEHSEDGRFDHASDMGPHRLEGLLRSRPYTDSQTAGRRPSIISCTTQAPLVGAA